MLPAQRRIARCFYVTHAITVIIGLGFFLCGFFTYVSEQGHFAKLELTQNSELVNISYFTSGILIFSAGLGVAAQIKGNRPCFWILYCILMGVMTLVEFSVGGSALGKGGTIRENAKKELLQKMSRYVGNTKTSEWDNLQRDRECCGVDEYADWQSVQFGRTSLKVPISCCLPRFREDIFCGTNLLPEHENASQLIFVRGCLKLLIEPVERNLSAMGFYALIISVLQGVLVGVASYLLITKQV